MKKSTLLGAFCVVAILGSSACSTPDAGGTTSSAATSGKDVTLKNSHSYRLSASSSTLSSIGVKTWHVLTEGDTKSVVLEGVDANGKVKFASSFRNSGGDLRVKSYRSASGDMTVTQAADRSLKVSGVTLALPLWRKHVSAFVADTKKGKVVTEYAKKATPKKSGPTSGTNVNPKIDVPINSPNVPVGSPQGPQSPTQNCGIISFGCSQKNDIQGNASDTMGDIASNLSDVNDAAGDANGVGSQDTQNDDTAGSADQNGDGTPDDQASDPQDGAQDDQGGDDGQGDGAADDQGDQGADDGSGDDGSGGDVGDEGDVGADSGDDSLDDAGGDEGGGDDGAGDEGGGDEGGGDSEFALHDKCRHLSCGKTSKLCICTRY